MLDLTIKRAVLEDAATLSKLSLETFFDTFTGTCTNADMDSFLEEYFNLTQVEKELSDPEDYFFVAWDHDKAVGYVRVKEDKSGVAEIDKHEGIELKRLYVRKEYHAKKVGAALTNYAIDFAKQHDYGTIFLSVWEFNEQAKKFYEKFGFEYTGYRHPFPIGNTPQTDVWMIKKI